MGIKFYKLDISGCDKKNIGPIAKLESLVVMDGQYGRDFDVVEELLPADLCNECRYETPWAKRHAIVWSERGFDEEVDFLPLGIDLPLPDGAILTEIEI